MINLSGLRKSSAGKGVQRLGSKLLPADDKIVINDEAFPPTSKWEDGMALQSVGLVQKSMPLKHLLMRLKRKLNPQVITLKK